MCFVFLNLTQVPRVVIVIMLANQFLLSLQNEVDNQKNTNKVIIFFFFLTPKLVTIKNISLLSSLFYKFSSDIKIVNNKSECVEKMIKKKRKINNVSIMDIITLV